MPAGVRGVVKSSAAGITSSTDNRATDTVWKGRPDLYHAYQRALYAGTPLERGLAASARLDPNA